MVEQRVEWREERDHMTRLLEDCRERSSGWVNSPSHCRAMAAMCGTRAIADRWLEAADENECGYQPGEYM